MHDFNAPTENDLEKKYISLEGQIQSLIIGEQNSTAILANVTAAISQTFDWLWVGFYLIEDSELVLGPFQGPVACFRIKKGEGVCGASWKEKKTIIVKDVKKFPGHIACSSFSKSEILFSSHCLCSFLNSERLTRINQIFSFFRHFGHSSHLEGYSFRF